MQGLPVILIFDVGKTNKKILLFDQQYKVVWETYIHLPETIDEDGFPCEDVNGLTRWISESMSQLMADARFDIRAVNFSAYGASFVYLDEKGNPILPIYNYLKPYPERWKDQFYSENGGEEHFAAVTASPVLGNLNSGMQLFRIKKEKPSIFKSIRYALHLPQYISSIVSGNYHSEITSIGCHTNLWDFSKNNYHDWVAREGLLEKFPTMTKGDETLSVKANQRNIKVGAGLHDSSAALIPYLSEYKEPFALISTGTWCITLNPFNHSPLKTDELRKDCLCYLSVDKLPVKASRLFAGHEHEEKLKAISEFFHLSPEYFAQLKFDERKHTGVLKNNFYEYADADEAYGAMMGDLISRQYESTNLVVSGTSVKRIFVDGGFGKNDICMNMLARRFKELKVYAASVSQASALGAALVIHKSWNSESIPAKTIEVRSY